MGRDGEVNVSGGEGKVEWMEREKDYCSIVDPSSFKGITFILQ